MFWTRGEIQTSFSFTEILFSIAVLLAVSVFYLWRIGLFKKKGDEAFESIKSRRKLLLKLSILPICIALFALFIDPHKVAVWIYGKENVVSNDYESAETSDVLAIISQVSGKSLFKWNGRFIKSAFGKNLVRYENGRFETPTGKPLFKWVDNRLTTTSGRNLFVYQDRIISRISGERLYKINLDHVSEISGSNILTIDNPYDVPEAVVVFITLYQSNLI